jgi:hypothetical protein
VREEGLWGFVTKLFKNIGICRVLLYEGRVGGQNLGKSRYVLSLGEKADIRKGGQQKGGQGKKADKKKGGQQKGGQGKKADNKKADREKKADMLKGRT